MSIAYLAGAGKAVVKDLIEPPTLTPETTQNVLRVKLHIEWAIPQQPRPRTILFNSARGVTSRWTKFYVRPSALI